MQLVCAARRVWGKVEDEEPPHELLGFISIRARTPAGCCCCCCSFLQLPIPSPHPPDADLGRCAGGDELLEEHHAAGCVNRYVYTRGDGGEESVGDGAAGEVWGRDCDGVLGVEDGGEEEGVEGVWWWGWCPGEEGEGAEVRVGVVRGGEEDAGCSAWAIAFLKVTWVQKGWTSGLHVSVVGPERVVESNELLHDVSGELYAAFDPVLPAYVAAWQ